MLKTPGGRPASIIISPSRLALIGTRSDGFRTNVFPQAMAMGNIQSGTMNGKLKGVIPAQTPTGWRVVSLSTLLSDVRQRVSHDEARDAAGELDDFDAALNGCLGFGKRLAMLARDAAWRGNRIDPGRSGGI